MTIKNKSAMRRRKIEIDLSGPDGNAYVLLGVVRNLAKVTKLDKQLICDEMMSGDYNHLIDVFDSYFGEYVTLYR